MTETRATTHARSVFIVDDHPIIGQAISQILAQQGDLHFAGQALNAAQAMPRIEQDRPDVVMVDLSLEEGAGIDLIRDLHSRYPDLPVLVFTMHEETRYAQRALRAGAKGYATKNETSESILVAIRTVLEGELYLSEALTPLVLAQLIESPKSDPDDPSETLTDREIEVYRLVGEGCDSRTIADRLFLSPKTVEVHRSNIKRKLHLKNSIELHQQAYEWVRGKKP